MKTRIERLYRVILTRMQILNVRMIFHENRGHWVGGAFVDDETGKLYTISIQEISENEVRVEEKLTYNEIMKSWEGK